MLRGAQVRDRRRRTATLPSGGALVAAAAVTAISILGCSAQSAAAPALTPGATSATARNGLIVFMRPGTIGEYDLWSVRPDGTGLRRLTESPANRSDYNPTWSPDGSVVLFERRKTADVPGSDEALYEVNAHGGGFRQITHCHGRCWSDGEPAWSASGRLIAFGRATGPRSAPGPSLIAIYIANANGTHIRQISKPPHGYEDHYPTWSPDGRTIVFQRDTSTPTPGQTKLIAVNVTTRRERIVYRIPKWAPGSGLAAVSPNGKRILFGYWCIYGDSCPPSTRAHRNATLATIHPDGTGLRHLHLKTGADSGNWSPDGKRIVFRCRSKPGTPTPPGLPPLAGLFRVCTSKLDGTGFRRFPWPVSSAEPDWGTHQ
jgi:Tol biopolymer transport system component